MKKYAIAFAVIALLGALGYAGQSVFQIYQGGTGQNSFSAGLLRSSGTALSSSELSGDASTSGSNAVTLASVVTAGSCGDSTHSCGLTYDAKGRITAATNNVISGGGGSSPSFFGLWNYSAPPSTGWTWDNQGTSTVDSTFGYEYAHLVSGAARRLRYRTANSTPYTYTFALLFDYSGVTNGPPAIGNTAGLSIGFRDGTGKLVGLFFFYQNNWNICVSHDTSSTSTGACAYSASAFPGPTFHIKNPTLLQLQDDGTNVTFNASIDGNHWYKIYQESRTAWFSSGPTQVFYGCFCSGGGVDAAVISMAATSP